MDHKGTIRNFLSVFFCTDDLTDGDDFFEKGFVNSLFAMQLVMFVEKEFSLRVEDEDLELQNFNTINGISNFVQRKVVAAQAVA